MSSLIACAVLLSSLAPEFLELARYRSTYRTPEVAANIAERFWKHQQMRDRMDALAVGENEFIIKLSADTSLACLPVRVMKQKPIMAGL